MKFLHFIVSVFQPAFDEFGPRRHLSKKTGSPQAPRSSPVSESEVQLETELDIAAFQRRSGRNDVATGLAFDGLDGGYTRARLDIKVAGINVHVAVIEGIVEFAAELQVEALCQLERLGNREVHVPKTRPDIGIAMALRQAAVAVHAARVIQAGTDKASPTLIGRPVVGSIARGR